jgi:hypothetical protein
MNNMKCIIEDCKLEALYVYDGNSLCVAHFICAKEINKHNIKELRKQYSKIDKELIEQGNY